MAGFDVLCCPDACHERVLLKELFISDDYHILTWFFRVEVRPLLISRLFLLKLGCVGQKTNRVYKLSCASLQLQSWRPCDFAAQVLPCVAVCASRVKPPAVAPSCLDRGPRPRSCR